MKRESTTTKKESKIEHYDMIVLGCGPAGQKAALAASKLGKKVALIEPLFLGGNSTHFGTLPSKTFREAAIHLTNYRLRFMDTQNKQAPTMKDLITRVQWVIHNQVKTIEQQLLSNKVQIIPGFGKFKDNKHIDVYNEKNKLINTFSFSKSVICTGSKPFLPPNVPFNGKQIFSSDDILSMEKIPRSLTIIGGGIIGCEYASIFSILGVKVNLIEKRDEILSLIDRDMRANLANQLDSRKTQLYLGEEMKSMKVGRDKKVTVELVSGKKIKSEKALVCIFRVVNTKAVNLDGINVKTNQRGLIEVNQNFQTSVSNIYAAGDVVGAPALASTSFEQGRIAATHAFSQNFAPFSPNVPIGIYTIPEISYAGPTESELTKKKIPYQVGKAFFKHTSRGAIMGALDGVLKIMFHQETRQLLAVHVIGENATELVHVGQVLIEMGGTIDYFIDKVFNYPTLAETYKYAALNGLNRMHDV